MCSRRPQDLAQDTVIVFGGQDWTGQPVALALEAPGRLVPSSVMRVEFDRAGRRRHQNP